MRESIILHQAIGDRDHGKVAPLPGLLVDFAMRESRAVIRGLRAISDFEFEFKWR